MKCSTLEIHLLDKIESLKFGADELGKIFAHFLFKKMCDVSIDIFVFQKSENINGIYLMSVDKSLKSGH